VLTVDVLILPVGDLLKLSGSRGAFATIINLKLYAKVAGRIPIEDGLRFVVVLMDGTRSLGLLIAVIAEGIGIIIDVIGGVHMKQSAATFTSGIGVVKTGLTERGVSIPGIVVVPDPCVTTLADHGLAIQAFLTQVLVMKLDQGVIHCRSALVADIRFSHNWYPP
jgi:hypothetical protein